MSHAEAIQKNHDVLQSCTTVNFYVIDYLRAEEVLDEEQEHDLKTERNPLKQRILLFQWLKKVSSDKYESFLQVMKDTEQEHVANLLTGRREEDYLPLSDVRYRRLVKIRHKMAKVTRIDSEVIAELRSLHAISMTDAEEIRAEKVDSTKVSKLISVIMRRSNRSYKSFQEVLRKTLQTAAADFLSEGEMPAVHLNNNRPDLDGPLSVAFNGVIRNRTTDDAEIEKLLSDLNGLGLNPVKTIPGQSIVIFIYCKTVDSAVNFTQLFNSGRLQHILESILSRLLLAVEPHNTEKLDSRVSLEDDEIITLEEFTGIEGWLRESPKRPSHLAKLCGRDATTQTDEQSIMKKFTEWTQSKPEEQDLCSSTYADENKERKLRDIIECTMSYDLFTQAQADEVMESIYEDIGEWPQIRHAEKNPYEQDVDSSEDELLKNMYYDIEGAVDVRYKSDPVLIATIRTHAPSERQKWINGLTILNNQLFVVRENSSEVEVHDSINFSFSRRWKLKELNDPWDIQSCNRNKCLYINDYKGYGQLKEILRVDSNGKLIKKWSTEDDFGWGLSVTSESNVILPVYQKNKLNEYSPDGQLIQEINLQLDAGFCYPLHAIKLANGHFVVSYGFDYLHRVCVVNSGGKLTKSFGGKPGSTRGQMNLPFHLSIDGNGFVMVVDRWNGRVLLLDSDLKFNREILSKEKHGLRRPRRILLDQENGPLFVAEDNRILIFDLK